MKLTNRGWWVVAILAGLAMLILPGFLLNITGIPMY